ncbi:hypothetical protein TTHERM_00128980 (macronuclear) [Tetrahymena thermophila SB210]|uniref:Uncharacterized protein n=1 Tax=Tetrahymena thermophila (strain SB210) TaxID=312017 RepID=I7LUV7_TETTS|nr:hypothetical protein TTHERM_00128980 [Tetrahymena thermophila SB210]EAR96134.2 hypothetical protein TTHERM_00128980 [Tetrahymena thermophila SB210]|eukprot:XP_001016379.2 hypothetical protein TTHERM_00128980 [Tetrahymena thermophila SB210]
MSIVIQKNINNLQYLSQITTEDIEQFLVESSRIYLNDQQEQFAQQNGFSIFAVSSATKRNVQTLKFKLAQAAYNLGLFKMVNIQITKNLANRKKTFIKNNRISSSLQ